MGERQESFDYVVVGAGSAGSALAARLTERPEVTVLLLESGSAEPHPLVAVPAAWPGLWGTTFDYAYRTVAQPALNGTEMDWPRGHGVGGSSAINGMVYLRGHRHDYDSWVTDFGARGWSYDEVLPYLRRLESVPGADPLLRGQDGPMRPTRAEPGHPLSGAFVAAAAEAGYPVSADLNGADADAAGWNDLSIVDGHRQTTSDAYLTPALDRPNLTVSADSRVQRLLLDGDRCTGVRYLRAGEVLQARADAEVILCAGAVDSPRLLLLSGIGPADELRAAGVDVWHDLPGVGRNLHDHPLTGIAYSANRTVPPGSQNLAEVSLSWRSDPSLGGPDMQIIFSHVPFHARTLSSPPDSYTFLLAVVPDSRGSLRLRDADPASLPLIDPNCLGSDRDLARLVDGIGVVRELARQAAFDPWRDEEVLPGSRVTDRAELAEFVRRATGSYFHPVGTCAMGTGPDAVVTPELAVRGVRNLRVADASVMPRIVSVNTNVASMMIGERAADLVLGRRASEGAATADRAASST